MCRRDRRVDRKYRRHRRYSRKMYRRGLWSSRMYRRMMYRRRIYKCSMYRSKMYRGRRSSVRRSTRPFPVTLPWSRLAETVAFFTSIHWTV